MGQDLKETQELVLHRSGGGGGEVQRLVGESCRREAHWASIWSRMNQSKRKRSKKGEDAGIVRTWLLLCS